MKHIATQDFMISVIVPGPLPQAVPIGAFTRVVDGLRVRRLRWNLRMAGWVDVITWGWVKTYYYQF